MVSESLEDPSGHLLP
ncbi:hypothetical protein A2U01_0077640, partial [Trifolium medium]|nr:hypothetical protein [Trifolium medium]